MVGLRVLASLSVMVAGAAASTAATQPPEPGFWATGLAPNANQGAVQCLTKDGTIAAGYSFGTSPYFVAGFTWTKAGGRSDFGLLPGMPKVNVPHGISDNGILAGVMQDGVSYDTMRAFRWTGAGPLQDLGVLPGHVRSAALDVNGDGSVIVGYVDTGFPPAEYGEAFRWTPTGGMQGLGYVKPTDTFSRANAVSRDGTTIVGYVYSFFGNDGGPFVWREATGMKALPGLPNAPGGGTAYAVSADGSVVVGEVPVVGGTGHAVRWVNGEIEDLAASGFGKSIAWAVSDDGRVVGGTYQSTPGGNAFVWSLATGILDVNDYLAIFGVVVPPNYAIEDIYAVSGDGFTFGGQAKNLTTGLREGFVATVPGDSCKPDCDASGGLDINDFICFQTRFAIGDPYADCDASGGLDIDDFICFQTLFAVGC